MKIGRIHGGGGQITFRASGRTPVVVGLWPVVGPSNKKREKKDRNLAQGVIDLQGMLLRL